jgi:LacI family transcriptional regulator
MPEKIRRVALIYNATLAYDLKVMAGVARYLRERTNYSIYLEENALKDQRLPALRSWGGDGIIADFDHPGVAKAVIQSKLPIVAFGGGGGGYVKDSQIPYFFTNNGAVADLAADHLLTRGLRNFAYCGFAPTAVNGWSQDRERQFVRRVRERGYSCDVYVDQGRTSRQWASVQRSLAAWLTPLPKPLGVMAANDSRARHILEACRLIGLRVPEEVAVIGVDNDELLCQLSSPPLTSIEQGAKRIGYEAAALLDRLMCGKKLRQRDFVIDPPGIFTRRSTDILAIDDPIVAKAMSFIQENAFTGVSAADIVHAVGVSRSGLEIRFHRALGYTVHAAIRRVQLERARRLISETNLPLKEIAASVGFRSIQHMTTLFGKTFHQSPAKYRRGVSLV